MSSFEAMSFRVKREILLLVASKSDDYISSLPTVEMTSYTN